jgi:hypothetical protein
MSAFALPIPPAPLTVTPSQAYGTLRYHVIKDHIRSFGVWLEPRYIFGAGRLDQ